jgi:hypothetical protein
MLLAVRAIFFDVQIQNISLSQVKAHQPISALYQLHQGNILLSLISIFIDESAQVTFIQFQSI